MQRVLAVIVLVVCGLVLLRYLLPVLVHSLVWVVIVLAALGGLVWAMRRL